MNWITDQVAIGNYLEALDADLIRRESLAAVLCLDGSLHGKSPAEVGLIRIETVCLEDAPGNDPRVYVRAVDTLQGLVSDSPPVLAQCHAGRSRSVVVVAGYLVKYSGMPTDEAIRRVAARREIAITPGLETLLDWL